MKEHPILFSGPMVKAILEGRKTQTRRVIKPQPVFDSADLNGKPYFRWRGLERSQWALSTYCPYGQVGDRLWVRETFYTDNYRRSNGLPVLYKADGETRSWLPSIHMPRWASRITLEITGVKVERIQEIQDTPTDALKEGIKLKQPYVHADLKVVADFKELWDSINAKRGYGWDVNPWDWALTFKVANA